MKSNEIQKDVMENNISKIYPQSSGTQKAGDGGSVSDGTFRVREGVRLEIRYQRRNQELWASVGYQKCGKRGALPRWGGRVNYQVLILYEVIRCTDDMGQYMEDKLRDTVSIVEINEKSKKLFSRALSEPYAYKCANTTLMGFGEPGLAWRVACMYSTVHYGGQVHRYRRLNQPELGS